MKVIKIDNLKLIKFTYGKYYGEWYECEHNGVKYLPLWAVKELGYYYKDDLIEEV